jgi:hypothetical protein
LRCDLEEIFSQELRRQRANDHCQEHRPEFPSLLETVQLVLPPVPQHLLHLAEECRQGTVRNKREKKEQHTHRERERERERPNLKNSFLIIFLRSQQRAKPSDVEPFSSIKLPMVERKVRNKLFSLPFTPFSVSVSLPPSLSLSLYLSLSLSVFVSVSVSLSLSLSLCLSLHVLSVSPCQVSLDGSSVRSPLDDNQLERGLLQFISLPKSRATLGTLPSEPFAFPAFMPHRRTDSSPKHFTLEMNQFVGVVRESETTDDVRCKLHVAPGRQVHGGQSGSPPAEGQQQRRRDI